MPAFKRLDLSKPSWRWSHRDWEVFRAYCHPGKRTSRRMAEIATAYRSGASVSEIAKTGEISRAYVYKMLAAEELRDRVRMDRFYERRRNLGRPIDMDGPRDEWIEWDVFDFQGSVPKVLKSTEKMT